MRHTECMRHTQSRTVRVPFKVCVRAREPGMEPGTLRPCHGGRVVVLCVLWLRMYVQLGPPTFTEHFCLKKCVSVHCPCSSAAVLTKLSTQVSVGRRNYLQKSQPRTGHTRAHSLTHSLTHSRTHSRPKRNYFPHQGVSPRSQPRRVGAGPPRVGK